MSSILFWLMVIIALAAAVVAAAWVARNYLTSGKLTGPLFAPKPEKRLAIMEQANVDGRRRLLLIRRDNVEHLIMTGGPVDVVIETGIGAPRIRVNGHDAVEGKEPVFTRAPRSLGQPAAQE